VREQNQVLDLLHGLAFWTRKFVHVSVRGAQPRMSSAVAPVMEGKAVDAGDIKPFFSSTRF
jgi:hypothetical protein